MWATRNSDRLVRTTSLLSLQVYVHTIACISNNAKQGRMRSGYGCKACTGTRPRRRKRRMRELGPRGTASRAPAHAVTAQRGGSPPWKACVVCPRRKHAVNWIMTGGPLARNQRGTPYPPGPGPPTPPWSGPGPRLNGKQVTYPCPRPDATRAATRRRIVGFGPGRRASGPHRACPPGSSPPTAARTMAWLGPVKGSGMRRGPLRLQRRRAVLACGLPCAGFHDNGVMAPEGLHFGTAGPVGIDQRR